MELTQPLFPLFFLFIFQFLLTNGIPVDPARRAVVTDVEVVTPPVVDPPAVVNTADITSTFSAAKLYDMLPNMPSLPDMSLPSLPSLSSLPSLPTMSIPSLSFLPSMPDMETVKAYMQSAVASGKDMFDSASVKATDAYQAASQKAADAYNSMPSVQSVVNNAAESGTTVSVAAVA